MVGLVLKVFNKGGIKMALISCPNCKNPVSDKAVVCPNCGYAGMGQSADAQNKIKCEDCGNEFENNLASCPVCGNRQPFQRSAWMPSPRPCRVRNPP